MFLLFLSICKVMMLVSCEVMLSIMIIVWAYNVALCYVFYDVTMYCLWCEVMHILLHRQSVLITMVLCFSVKCKIWISIQILCKHEGYVRFTFYYLRDIIFIGAPCVSSLPCSFTECGKLQAGQVQTCWQRVECERWCLIGWASRAC